MKFPGARIALSLQGTQLQCMDSLHGQQLWKAMTEHPSSHLDHRTDAQSTACVSKQGVLVEISKEFCIRIISKYRRWTKGQARQGTYLASKTVFLGFKAAWFFAASPINRSFSEKATKEGVTRLPCSLATIAEQNCQSCKQKWVVLCLRISFEYKV